MVSGNKQSTNPSSTSRRCYTKSRNGCSQCKKRKVKCDEQAPCCRNCKKRRVRCDFETSWPNSERSPSSQSDIIATSQAIESSPVTLSQQQLAPASKVFSPHSTISYGPWMENQSMPLRELQLMHHYATTVFLSLAADSDAYCPVWQFTVPQEAQSSQFVMHAILAISALHLSHVWSSDEGYDEQAQSYKQTALTHCNSAAALFRSTVSTITSSNVNAFFAFSHLLIIFAFGSPVQAAKDRKMEDPIGDLLEVITILRSSMQVIRESWNLVEGGSMGPLLQRGPAITDRQYLPADAADALKNLEQFCEVSLAENDKRKKLYSYAIQQLYDSFVMMDMKRPDWGIALRFPLILSDSLLTLLKMREPMSLVVLAHYCIILYRAPMRWWVADWSVQVIEAVSRSLDDDWRQVICWPLEVISEGK